jgi:predicted outer membrane protein
VSIRRSARGAVVVVAVVMACRSSAPSSDERPLRVEPTANELARGTPSSDAHAAMELTEAEVLAVLGAGDRAFVDQAGLARTRAEDPRVRGLAESLAAEHAASASRLVTLRDRLAITPAEGVLSHTLAETSSATLRRLPTLRGAVFDREYVDAQALQLANHLDAVDSALAPNARSEALREALQRDVRPALNAQLRRTRALQDALNGP